VYLLRRTACVDHDEFARGGNLAVSLQALDSRVLRVWEGLVLTFCSSVQSIVVEVKEAGEVRFRGHGEGASCSHDETYLVREPKFEIQESIRDVAVTDKKVVGCG
jgi:hypothetical protein